MSKAGVVLLGVLCVLVAAGSYGVIQALGKVGADLHRGAVALDALAIRMGAVEEDLATLSEDVAAIADSVALLADSLIVEDDGEQGEAVRFRGGEWRVHRLASRACARPRLRVPDRGAGRAPRAATRVKQPCVRSRSAGGRSGSSPG